MTSWTHQSFSFCQRTEGFSAGALPGGGGAAARPGNELAPPCSAHLSGPVPSEGPGPLLPVAPAATCNPPGGSRTVSTPPPTPGDPDRERRNGSPALHTCGSGLSEATRAQPRPPHVPHWWSQNPALFQAGQAARNLTADFSDWRRGSPQRPPLDRDGRSPVSVVPKNSSS